MGVAQQVVGVSQKAVILNDAGEILTLHRTHTAPSRPLTWDLPGGDIDFGEDPLSSMEREIKEETGIEVEDLIPFDVKARVTKDGVHWITIGYKAKAISDKVVISWEHDEYRWVKPEEFLELESSIAMRGFVKRLMETV